MIHNSTRTYILTKSEETAEGGFRLEFCQFLLQDGKLMTHVFEPVNIAPEQRENLVQHLELKIGLSYALVIVEDEVRRILPVPLDLKD